MWEKSVLIFDSSFSYISDFQNYKWLFCIHLVSQTWSKIIVCNGHGLSNENICEINMFDDH